MNTGQQLNIANSHFMDETEAAKRSVRVPPIRDHVAACDHVLHHKGHQAVAREVGDLTYASPAENLTSGSWPLQRLATGADHRASQFMQPGPSGLIASQTQEPLEALGAAAGLLGADPPHGSKPDAQRLARAVHDGPSGQRDLASTGAAHQQISLVDPGLSPAAHPAAEAVRPAYAKQVLLVGFLGAKALIELAQGGRVVLRAHRTECYSMA